MQGFESRLSSKISWPLFFCFLVGCSEQKKVSTSIKNSGPDLVSGMVVAPGIKEGKIIAPLEDAWRRIDPKEDGWDSEVFNEIATKKLKNLSKIMKESNLITEKDLQGIQGNDYNGN